LQFKGSNAWIALETIMGFNPRYPGTTGINLTAASIESALLGNGGSITEENFTVNSVPCKNIIGKWKPAINNGEIVIFGSHYDARARATQDHVTDSVPAANDGGSSTVILMELARILNKIYANTTLGIHRETWLVFFDAEDQGNDGKGDGISGWDWCKGSQLMATNLNTFTGNTSHVVQLVLLDMVGGTGLQVNHEMYSNQSLLSAFFSMGQCLGYGQYFPSTAKTYYVEDDHGPFITAGIPSIDIIDMDYPQWHTTSDDLSHVSAAVIGSIGRVSEAYLLSSIVDSSLLSITDPDTGKTWTENSCTSSDSWFAFVAFIGQYWPYLILGGIAIVAVLAFLYKHAHQRANGEPSHKLARKNNKQP
jgi:glutaminyl-peptide cyclotransferase